MGGAGEKRRKGDSAWVVPRQENVFPFALASKFAFALPCELHQLEEALIGDFYSHLKATWVSALLQSASLIINTGVSPGEDAASAVEDEERGEETRHCSGGVLSNNTTALQPA